jgi:hypothetical protein
MTSGAGHRGHEESTPSCDPDHLTVVVLDARLEAVMAKKAIAAMLLVAMAAWTEMAMAPMLVMHAAHMRPGHEMAADMPAEHAGHHHGEHAQMAGHPCCPGLHKAEPEAMLALTASTPACDDPHSCCFRQGPQSVPAPASNVQKLVRDIALTGAAKVSPTVEAAERAIDNKAFAFRPPPDLFGVTLRV